MSFDQLLFLLQALVAGAAVCAGLLLGLVVYLVPTWAKKLRDLRRAYWDATDDRDAWMLACVDAWRQLDEIEQARRWGPPC